MAKQECGGNGLCINNGHSTIDGWNVFWCITNQSAMCSLNQKMLWMRARRMPSHQTRNHAWRVAHQISLRSQQTDRCKCGGRIIVDNVHFECRFVKPLWEIFTQANGLSVNSFVPQTQRAFLGGTLFQSRFRRKMHCVT